MSHIRVAMFPDVGGNPYVSLLHSALESAGAEFVGGHNGLLGLSWLRQHRHSGIVLYMHWLNNHYCRERIPSPWLALKFIAKLLLARLWGYRFVWTCHNVVPHEHGYRGWLHHYVRSFYTRMSETIFIHSEISRALFQKHFAQADKCVVIPHGNFINVYGKKQSRPLSRGHLGIDDDVFLVSFVGKIRRYKGIECLIDDFAKIAGARQRLIIAGLSEPGYDKELVSRAGGHDGIDFRFGWISDETLLEIISGSDAIVFPFRSILNSGSVILGMSYSALCIVPKMGSIPEILPEDAAIYFQPNEDGDIRAALQRAVSMSPDEADAIRRRAYRAAQKLRWDTAATRVLEALVDAHA